MATGMFRLAWAAAIGGASLATALTPALASPLGAHAGDGTATLSAEDEEKAKRLAERLCQTLHGLPDGSRPEQYEAAIVYTLSQVTDPYGIRQTALRRLPTSCDLNPAMVAALNNAQLADGTGALGPGFGGNGGTGFSNPGVDVGGGSVNYSSGGAR